MTGGGRALRIGCVAAVGVVGVGVIAAVDVVNSLQFPSYETGMLSASSARDVTVPSRQHGGVLEVVVRVNPEAFRIDRGQDTIHPVELSARIQTGGAGRADQPAPDADVQLTPLDAAFAVAMEPDDASRWRQPCPANADEVGCTGRYMLTLVGPVSADDRTMEVSVSAEMRYPPNVPAPDGANLNIDLSARSADLISTPTRARPASGELTLSADTPVQAIEFDVRSESLPARTEDGDPIASHFILTASATRHGEVQPAGMDAPAAVRLSLADGTTGQGVGTLDLLATESDAQLIVPALAGCDAAPCQGSLVLVAEWFGRRPEAAYHMTWSVAAVVLTEVEATVEISEGQAVPPRAADRASASGSIEMEGARTGARLTISLDLSDPLVRDPTEVPIDSVLVRIRIQAQATDAVPSGRSVAFSEVGAWGPARPLDVPFVVPIGGEGELSLNLLDGCVGGERCTGWHVTMTLVDESGLEVRETAPVEVHWEVEAVAFPLLPDGGAMRIDLTAESS